MQYLEKINLTLGVRLMHKDPTTKVQRFYKEYVSHTYTPDFHDIINNIVYEVKSS